MAKAKTTKRAAKKTPAKTPAPARFSNLERIARMAATFGLEPPAWALKKAGGPDPAVLATVLELFRALAAVSRLPGHPFTFQFELFGRRDTSPVSCVIDNRQLVTPTITGPSGQTEWNFPTAESAAERFVGLCNGTVGPEQPTAELIASVEDRVSWLRSLAVDAATDQTALLRKMNLSAFLATLADDLADLARSEIGLAGLVKRQRDMILDLMHKPEHQAGRRARPAAKRRGSSPPLG